VARSGGGDEIIAKAIAVVRFFGTAMTLRKKIPKINYAWL
jgi:hypothetical protein